MEPLWRVVIRNGTFPQVIRQGITTRQEADAIAERWQGSHSGNRGLLKHKDRGDYVEVERDHQSEREMAQRIADAKAGKPQTTIWQGEEQDLRRAGLIK